MDWTTQKNYQVEFQLERLITESANEFVIRHAQAEKTDFGQETLRRMAVKDYREQNPDYYKEPEEKIYTIHNHIPSFVKERQKPSPPTEMNITIEDAARLNLICKTVRDVLSYGDLWQREKHPLFKGGLQNKCFNESKRT